MLMVSSTLSPSDQTQGLRLAEQTLFTETPRSLVRLCILDKRSCIGCMVYLCFLLSCQFPLSLLTLIVESSFWTYIILLFLHLLPMPGGPYAEPNCSVRNVHPALLLYFLTYGLGSNPWCMLSWLGMSVRWGSNFILPSVDIDVFPWQCKVILRSSFRYWPRWGFFYLWEPEHKYLKSVTVGSILQPHHYNPRVPPSVVGTQCCLQL